MGVPHHRHQPRHLQWRWETYRGWVMFLLKVFFWLGRHVYDLLVRIRIKEKDWLMNRFDIVNIPVGEDEPQNPSGWYCWYCWYDGWLVCRGGGECGEGSCHHPTTHRPRNPLLQNRPGSHFPFIFYQFIIISHLSLINSWLLGQGGFSQGGMVAFGAGLTWKEKLAGWFNSINYSIIQFNNSI